MNKIYRFIKDLVFDYEESDIYIKRLKRNCYRQTLNNIFSYVWSIITAPLIYPIWYILRKYPNIIPRWLYMYGDLHDPLGRGGMPEYYKDGKNNFINRYLYSAIRNPRFTYNFLKYNSGIILYEHIIIDTRNFNIIHKSNGIGDSPDGIIFKWFIDYEGELYFIYENNTKESLFWIGWTGLLKKAINNSGRFEMAYRMQKR